MLSAPLTIANRVPADNAAGGVCLGLVRAEGILPTAQPPGLDDALAALSPDLDAAREARRLAARDMPRNGRHTPTGRGTPASEYRLRALADGDFPRINAPVDVNNLVSAGSALPISLWDLDRADADRYVFRLGRAGEAYVFNASGQTLDAHDLVVGCRVRGEEEPIVSPIKDGHATKTTPETRRVAGCVYAPANAVSLDELRALCETFAGWLARCGEEVRTSVAVAGPGETVSL